MGSGASKADSSQHDPAIRTPSSVTDIRSELNNNNKIEKLVGGAENDKRKNSLKTGKDEPIGLQQPEHNQRVPNESSLQSNKSTRSQPKTDVIRLKPDNIEQETKVQEYESSETKQLKEELSLSESQRLDLQDQIHLLEEKLASKQQQHNVKSIDLTALQETLNAKDHYILKLEKEAKTRQAESNKLRIRLKKKIKGLTNQLHEVRQEASINQMELKAEILKRDDQIKTLQGERASSQVSGNEKMSNQDPSHSKIIVELSSQLSEQAEQISSLEAELSAKKKEISDLKLAISNHYDSKDLLSSQNSSPMLAPTSTDRLHSSRGKRVTISNDHSLDSTPNNLNTSSCFEGKNFENSQKPFKRESTALSDSDSDWGDNSIPSHTHSAPARSRVKSAVSLASSGTQKGSLTTLHGNDDSIMDLVSASPIDPEHRTDSSKRSAYRNHLQKIKTENQTDALIGPTLAFERKADPFSDTSCEPTPRTQRAAFQNNSRIRIVKPIVN